METDPSLARGSNHFDPEEEVVVAVKVVDMPSMICQLAVLDVAPQVVDHAKLDQAHFLIQGRHHQGNQVVDHAKLASPLVTKTYLQERYQVLPPFKNDTANAYIIQIETNPKSDFHKAKFRKFAFFKENIFFVQLDTFKDPFKADAIYI